MLSILDNGRFPQDDLSMLISTNAEVMVRDSRISPDRLFIAGLKLLTVHSRIGPYKRCCPEVSGCSEGF